MRIALLISGLLWMQAAAGEEPERPSELPPLLKVPAPEGPPAAGPRGPNGEYDPGYFYLPERAPVAARRPDPCGPDGRIWIGAGLELAWMKSAASPPVLAIGADAPRGLDLNHPMQAGLRVETGIWLNDIRTLGFDASALYLNAGGTETTIGPTNTVKLVLPPSFILADPTTETAGAFQSGFNTRFATVDVNQRTNWLCSPKWRLDSLLGYRFARLADDFEIYGKRLSAAGEIVRFRDQAHALNNFHGGQIGLAGEYREGRWFVTGSGKVAFGVVFSDTEVEGQFRVNGSVAPSGYFATSERSGERKESRFAVLPVVNASFGRQIGDHGRLAVGYQFLYLSAVSRAPELLAAAGTSPTTGFWVQSLNLTAEWRY